MPQRRCDFIFWQLFIIGGAAAIVLLTLWGALVERDGDAILDLLIFLITTVFAWQMRQNRRKALAKRNYQKAQLEKQQANHPAR